MQRELGLVIYVNPLGDVGIAVTNANNICKRELLQQSETN